MDDRLYLAVYDEERMRNFCELGKEDYVCDTTLPGYEFCETGGFQAIRKSRFSEVACQLYQMQEEHLQHLDRLLAPELARHQAMAADEERLYNVYVYVAEES